MTNEELDEARAKEAQRLWEGGQETGSSSWVVAARLARENWTPPEPMDPDVLAYREWYAGEWPLQTGESILAGAWDHGIAATGYLAGARMARKREQERAQVLVEFAKSRVPLTDAADVALAKYRGEA